MFETNVKILNLIQWFFFLLIWELTIMYEQAATPVKESTCIHFLVVRGWNYGIPQPQSVVSFVLILTCQRLNCLRGSLTNGDLSTERHPKQFIFNLIERCSHLFFTSSKRKKWRTTVTKMRSTRSSNYPSNSILAIQVSPLI